MGVDSIFPTGPAIPLVYQYHLLRDEERMALFAQAIQNSVKPGDTVLDLGCGTGIMSFLAAKRGATVVAIESDGQLATHAKKFLTANGASFVQVICGEAATVELPKTVDGIICEMMFVGLLVEAQWRVIRSVLQRLSTRPRYIIPCTATMSVTAGHGNFCYNGYEAPFAHAYAESDFSPLTQPYVYSSVKFNACPDDDLMDIDAILPVVNTGRLNAIKLSTETEIGPGLWSRGSTEFCWPFVFPTRGNIHVNSGDR